MPTCCRLPGVGTVMCSNRVWVSDLSTCTLLISLCIINWPGKEKVALPDDIFFRVWRRWDWRPGQDPGKAWVENFRLSNQTCLLVIFQMLSAASFLYLPFQMKESIVLMLLKITSIQLLGSFHLPRDGEVSWDFACVCNCFLKPDSYKKIFQLLHYCSEPLTHARMHTHMHS